MSAPPLEELRALFTGVPGEDNEWATSPCYRVPLAFEIAKRCDTQTEFALRVVLYDDTPGEQIPGLALEAIKLAVQRYREDRDRQKRSRGL